MKQEKQKKEEQGMREEINLQESSASFDLDEGVLTIKGAKGEAKKKLKDPAIKITVEGSKIVLQTAKYSKRHKKKIGTFKAHIKNMVRGSKEGHKYILKICSGHFPISVSLAKKEFVVKNFFGEKVPRVLKIKEGADVKIDGDNIVVESTSKELAGQTAADIEQLTRISNKDLRIFQDGIYIINKDGEEIK